MHDNVEVAWCSPRSTMESCHGVSGTWGEESSLTKQNSGRTPLHKSKVIIENSLFVSGLLYTLAIVNNAPLNIGLCVSL